MLKVDHFETFARRLSYFTSVLRNNKIFHYASHTIVSLAIFTLLLKRQQYPQG